MHSIEMKWSFELRNCRGYRYLYIVQKAWTKKGPRNVRQIYIGTASKLYERLHARRGPSPFGLSRSGRTRPTSTRRGRPAS